MLILKLLETKLPKELIYDYIIPFVPSFHITASQLKTQKKNIYIYAIIQEKLKIQDPLLKQDLLHHHDGDSEYIFDHKNMFLYINLNQNYRLKPSNIDYFCIFF